MFLEKMTSQIKYLEEAFIKCKNLIELPIYRIYDISEKIDNKNFERYSINIEEAIKDYKGKTNNINLVKINLKKDIPLIYLTNIIFYENNNMTLPKGSYNTKDVLVDLGKIELKEKNREKIILNRFSDNVHFSKNINIIEYDSIIKEEKGK